MALICVDCGGLMVCQRCGESGGAKPSAEPKRRRVKASAYLGIGGAPYNRVALTIDAGAERPPPGSPDHKRLADSIIAGVRAENQRSAIHMESAKIAAEYDADADSLVEEMMRAVEQLMRDRFGESYANRAGDMTFADAMGTLDGAVSEIPAAFRGAIGEWRQNNPKARLTAPEIYD